MQDVYFKSLSKPVSLMSEAGGMNIVKDDDNKCKYKYEYVYKDEYKYNTNKSLPNVLSFAKTLCRGGASVILL